MSHAPDPQPSQLLYEQLYRHVLDRLRAGELRPGDRVPSESELADRFGVSRITSRRALQALERANLVTRIRGKGSYVADPLPDLQDAPMRARLDKLERIPLPSI